jgi:hypothetical protein
MSILNFKFWSAAPITSKVAEVADTQVTANGPDGLSNVVQLPLGCPIDAPAGLTSEAIESAEQATQSAQKVNTAAGLMAASELQAFFSINFFGLGRHNGSNYKTQDAQTLGKAALVAQFQNVVAGVISQKQAKVDGLRNMELQIDGVCSTATGQLRLACTRLERDMATLQTQMDLAIQSKGWVLAALNEYQIGFGKGLREAIDAEVLGL